MEELDHTCTEEIVCPYCGYVDTDSWEWNNGQEGDADTECGECGKEFSCSRNVEVTYTTSKPVVRKLSPRQQECVRETLAMLGDHTTSAPIEFIALDESGFYVGSKELIPKTRDQLVRVKIALRATSIPVTTKGAVEELP